VNFATKRNQVTGRSKFFLSNKYLTQPFANSEDRERVIKSKIGDTCTNLIGNDDFDIQNPTAWEPLSQSFENFHFKRRLSKSKVISLDIRQDEMFSDYLSIFSLYWIYFDIFRMLLLQKAASSLLAKHPNRRRERFWNRLESLIVCVNSRSSMMKIDIAMRLSSDYNYPTKFLLSWYSMNLISILLLFVKKSGHALKSEISVR
jgi:hypothetical protein